LQPLRQQKKESYLQMTEDSELVDMCRQLEERPGFPLIKDEFKNTPLHRATLRDKLEMVELLAPLSNLSMVGTSSLGRGQKLKWEIYVQAD